MLYYIPNKQQQSCSFDHEVDPGFLPFLPEPAHRIDTPSNSHQQSSKAAVDHQFVAFLFHIKHNSIGDIFIAISFRRLVEFLVGVDIFDVAAVGDSDEEGVIG